MKKIIYTAMIILISTSIFALDYPDGPNGKAWHLLEMGKHSYEQGYLGEAMVYAGRAQDIHRQYYTKMYKYLYEALKSKQVKIAGDRISDVYSILLKREDKPACAFLDEIFLTNPPQNFNRSISTLMNWLNAKKDSFPEGYYLKASVFDAEGEFQQAMFYYNKAWEEREFLDVPDVRFDIIYAMADVSKQMKKFDDREKYLLLILTEDPIFGNTTIESKTLNGMLRSIKTNKVTDKFFMLYRHNMGICLRAYHELAKIYLEAENYDRALKTSTVAASIAITLLEEAVQKNDFLYEYKSFSDLLTRASNKPKISDWAESLQLWDIILTFADVLKETNHLSQAKDLYKKLANTCPSYEITRNAFYRLETMHSEQIQKDLKENIDASPND